MSTNDPMWRRLRDRIAAVEVTVEPGEWTTLLPNPITDFDGAGWYDTTDEEFLGLTGLRWRTRGAQIEIEGHACYLDGAGDPATPGSLAVICAAPATPVAVVGTLVATSDGFGGDFGIEVATIGTDITTTFAPTGPLTRFFSTLYDPAP